MKKILYLDMDGVLADFLGAVEKTSPEIRAEYGERLDEIPGIFAAVEPTAGALAAFDCLYDLFDVYVLSTPCWSKPESWVHKLNWVKQYLGPKAEKRLILSHHKNLNAGDFLVDDRTKNGAGEFTGELIAFGSEKFPDWAAVVEYLKDKA